MLTDDNRELLLIVRISRGLKPNEERSFERSLRFDTPALSRIISQQIVYFVVFVDEKHLTQREKQGDLESLSFILIPDAPKAFLCHSNIPSSIFVNFPKTVLQIFDKSVNGEKGEKSQIDASEFKVTTKQLLFILTDLVFP